MSKFLSAQKNIGLNDCNPRTASAQFKLNESHVFKDSFNVSQYLKTQQQCKKNKWLGNIHQKPLLQALADSIQVKQFTPINSTELNCYQRLKKLLAMQSGTTFGQKRAEQNTKILNNVVTLQSQISKFQAKFRRQDVRKDKQNKSAKSAIGSETNSFFQRTSAESSLNTTQKSLIFKQTSKFKKRVNEPKSQKEQIKQVIKDDIVKLKEKCRQKYLTHKKKLNDDIFSEFQQYISSSLQRKIDSVIDCRLKQAFLAREETKRWKIVLLEKDLEIQGLRRQLKAKEQKITNTLKITEPQQELTNYRKNIQLFYQEYESAFGTIRVNQLEKKLGFLQKMYINKYANQEAKFLERLNKTEEQKRQIVKNTNQKLLEYQQRQKQLEELIYRRKKYQQLDNSDETHQVYNKINFYKGKYDQLQELQKFIFNKYTQWLSRKSEAQNKIIQVLNNNKVQEYKQMIGAMLQFEKSFGSQHKNIQFQSKLCSAIAKIKKIIFPSSVYKKLEPIKTLQQIEMYLLGLRRKTKKTKTITRAKQYLNDQQN